MTILKEGTAPLHQKIESVLPLLSPDLTLEQYKHYLSRMYSWYVPFEKSFAGIPSTFSEKLLLNKRLKVDWLISDLQELGFSQSMISALPVFDKWPPLEIPFGWIGALYVVEGSTLGGQIIHRRLQSQLALKPNQLRFLEAYGPQTGLMWTSFRVTAQELTPPNQYQDVLNAATATFELMTNWLQAGLATKAPQ
jgi:heme oxygenase